MIAGHRFRPGEPIPQEFATLLSPEQRTQLEAHAAAQQDQPLTLAITASEPTTLDAAYRVLAEQAQRDGLRWSIAEVKPWTAQEKQWAAYAAAKNKTAVVSLFVPDWKEQKQHDGRVRYFVDGVLQAETFPDPQGTGWISRRYDRSGGGSFAQIRERSLRGDLPYDEDHFPTPQAARRDSREHALQWHKAGMSLHVDAVRNPVRYLQNMEEEHRLHKSIQKYDFGPVIFRILRP
ncbi:MAG: hypothetical protein IRY99_23540 [Isosphaeraceae bacterium]|nr:hypothetical protein [Isosphaeraceae bacterium]